jgi:hypothetical protein
MYTQEIAELYALACPETGEVRYIGKARSAASRLKTHLRDAATRDTPVYRWIRKLRDAGKTPACSVLMLTWDWRAAERELIAQAKADGVRLLNVADGGDEPYCSKEQRAENGRRNAAAIHGDKTSLKRRVWEMNRRIGAAVARGELSEANKAKIRLAAQKAPHFFGKWAGI